MKSNYRKLQVWEKSFRLSVLVYETLNKFPKSEQFGLISQMQRAAVSVPVPSNIAEGSRRNSEKEFIHFLSIARGSVNELETQILLSTELGYISSEENKELLSLCLEVLKMISALISKLKTNN